MPERLSEKYYHEMARFYDAFSERPDETLYLELAKQFGSPILELACGTGRITFMLAQAGYEVTGIELSHEMLEIAKEKLEQLPDDVQSRVSLYEGDITNFKLDKKYAMVIIPWSFKYLLTTDDQLACLVQVRKHLDDGGAFILDLYPHEITRKDGTEKQTVEIDGSTITRTYTYSTNFLTQLRHTTTHVDITHPNGKTEHLETMIVLALIMPREAELLVRIAGFEIVKDYGGNDFSEYKPGDWKRVLVLKKKSDS